MEHYQQFEGQCIFNYIEFTKSLKKYLLNNIPDTDDYINFYLYQDMHIKFIAEFAENQIRDKKNFNVEKQNKLFETIILSKAKEFLKEINLLIDKINTNINQFNDKFDSSNIYNEFPNLTIIILILYYDQFKTNGYSIDDLISCISGFANSISNNPNSLLTSEVMNEHLNFLIINYAQNLFENVKLMNVLIFNNFIVKLRGDVSLIDHIFANAYANPEKVEIILYS
jgi:hypothetical protein